jgi:hypothetical protein
MAQVCGRKEAAAMVSVSCHHGDKKRREDVHQGSLREGGGKRGKRRSVKVPFRKLFDRFLTPSGLHVICTPVVDGLEVLLRVLEVFLDRLPRRMRLFRTRPSTPAGRRRRRRKVSAEVDLDVGGGGGGEGDAHVDAGRETVREELLRKRKSRAFFPLFAFLSGMFNNVC